MAVAVRFAPSPTGKLHVGNIRLALVNWLFARAEGGRFLLRLDDTDQERSAPAFAAAIEADLAWLGLTWDQFARQSDRLDRYDGVIRQLTAAGRLYPCYETPEDLALKRKAQLAANRPPLYDRAGLRLDPAGRAALEAAGRTPHWRFRLDHTAIAWDDLVRGPVRFEGADLSDPVLVREDGRPLYGLCSVVDDIDFAITHVIRGEDHVANTALQIQLWQALGAAPPVFAHLPLLTDAAGQGLSKRLGSLSVQSLREEEGLEPLALASLLAKLGTSDPIEPRLTLEALAAEFSFAKISRAPARFDLEDLRRLNARLLHALPYDQVQARLHADHPELDQAFWDAVRPNLTRFSQCEDWWRVARTPVTPVIADPEMTRAAAGLLPPEPWSEATWPSWIAVLRPALGLSGKALFHPLRLALTGRDQGPELRVLLPLIGRTRAKARLLGETA